MWFDKVIAKIKGAIFLSHSVVLVTSCWRSWHIRDVTSVMWCGWLQVRLKLQKVSLLFEDSRHHFALSHRQLSAHCQLADGDVFIVKSSSRGKSTKYEVEVCFTGGMFGLFRQWLIFDFGDRPVLMRELTVELGQAECRSQVRSLREKLEFDRYSVHHTSFTHVYRRGVNAYMFAGVFCRVHLVFYHILSLIWSYRLKYSQLCKWSSITIESTIVF